MPRYGRDLIAHSAATPNALPDPYPRHIAAVRGGAQQRASEMLRFAEGSQAGALLEAIGAAATFHDLGKVDPDNQAALRQGRGGRLRWDHIDAGVAHLSAHQDWMAAWMVRAHHAPGLPEKEQHFDRDKVGRRLRGRRGEDVSSADHDTQIARTDANLRQYVESHEEAVGVCQVMPHRPIHGLPMRLSLSCLVDADHADTAFCDTGRAPPHAPDPRWAERLTRLAHYVRSLPAGVTDDERERNLRRAEFFRACFESPITERLVACEGPVGLGKTTAVAAYLMRRARDEGLRRLIIVAPYTNILTQTARRLRQALCLPEERPSQVVIEHHHRADFESPESRDLAALWQAPVVLTTAVSFFEALGARAPGTLRKLHAVPGSAIFLDEAHAALPAELWPQAWRWLRELTEQWGCRIVFASGSLARFWEHREIVETPIRLPELLPPSQADRVLDAERRRIRYLQLAGGRVISVKQLISHIRRVAGPRLVILNTVQSAAVVARAMRSSGCAVLHLSTALTPGDRERILSIVKRRLRADKQQWTLVATSCVEAGVDLSFRCAFRERFAVASTIQVGGRVNRHGEYDAHGGGIVYDFAIDDAGITRHPAASVSADILRELLRTDELNRLAPADIVTRAMREEIERRGGLGTNTLQKAEAARDYPEVQRQARVIDADTRLVVVDQRLKERLATRRPVTVKALLSGSVQLWATKVAALRLAPLPGRRELYAWNDSYDPRFLGIMAGVLRTDAFVAAGGGVI